MVDEISPLFAHSEPSPNFTIKELSRALEKTGIEYPTANARVASYAKHRFIHVREKGAGATSPNKFWMDDMAAAMLLSAAQDMGIADQSVLGSISDGLYAWTPGVKVRSVHPTRTALIETLKGEAFWQLQVDFFRHLQTGQREIVISFFRSGEINPAAPVEAKGTKELRKAHPKVKIKLDPRADDDCWPVATIIIPATTHLLALKPFIRPEGH